MRDRCRLPGLLAGGAELLASGLAVTLAALTLLPSGMARAATPGSLDPSFGDRGVVGLNAPAGGSLAGGAMAIGPEDDIYALMDSSSCAHGPCGVTIRVERLTPRGRFDASFGVDGVSEPVTLPGLPGATPQADSIAVGPGGSSVVAAESGGRILLLRWRADGRLDPTFGSGGAVEVDFGGFESHPEIAVRPNGSVVLVVSTTTAGSTRWVLARYRPGGSLDPRFAREPGKVGGPGWVSVAGDYGGMSVASGGAVAVAGNRCCGLGVWSAFADLRRSDGIRRPPRTSRSGLFRYRFGAGVAVSSVVALPNGKVYVVGIRNDRGFAAKLLPNGHLDRRYGRHRGWVDLGGISAFGEVRPVAAVDDVGRLLVVGSPPKDSEMAGGGARIVRRNPGGEVDRSWSEGMPVDASLLAPAAPTAPLAIGLQTGGGIVLFGRREIECFRYCPPSSLSVMRLIGGPGRVVRPHGLHRH